MSTEQATRPAHAGRPEPGLIGRAELVDAVESQRGEGYDVVLTGPSGIGKTAIIHAVAERARARGELVLHTSGIESERWIDDAALADLLTQIPQQHLDDLPGPQRAAAAVVLQDTEPPAGDRPRFARQLAWRSLLRCCAGEGPVLVLVDDAHWIDPSSMDVLRHAACRLNGGSARTVLAGTPPAQGDTHELGRTARCPWLLHDSATELHVPPLAAADMVELLDTYGLPARTASRLHADSGGNPYLALALGGVFTGVAPQANARVPLPRNLHLALGQRVSALAGGTRETLLLVALADRCTMRLLHRAGRPDAARDIREAAAAGVVTVDDDIIRFTPPVVRTVVTELEPETRRRAAHITLAAAVTDSAARARHRALACTSPNTEVAHSLVTAAESARTRGTRALAAELYLLAAERAPQEQDAERVAWLVTAAELGAAASRAEIVHYAADAVLATDSSPAERVRARMAVIDLSGQALAQMDETFAAALHDAEHAPELLAPLRLRMSWAALVGSDPGRGRREADDAIELARANGDTATAAMALANKAMASRVMGCPEYRVPLEQARRLPGPYNEGWLHLTPRFTAARFDVFDDRLRQARTEHLRMLAAVERGTGEELIEVVRSLAEICARLGRCTEALEYSERAVRIAEHAGLSPGPSWYSRAMAELAGGSLTQAAAYARRGIRASEQEQDGIFLSRHLHVLAQVLLRQGKADNAAAMLRRVQALQQDQGVAAPLVMRWHGDLACALVTLGAHDEAAELIASTRAQLGDDAPSGAVHAELDRALALVRAARGELDEALEVAEDADRRFRELAQPLELGHCLLVEGQLHRRRRKYAPARAAVDEALEIFTRHQAKPWIEQAQRKLVAVDGADEPDGRGQLANLTDAEQRIAWIVAGGASNQEAAARTYVSVKTIEAALTRVYRKLGVRSRTQLSSLLHTPHGADSG